jgi:2,3-bisphosphoglycerate-independent phosphoglycerate mutase
MNDNTIKFERAALLILDGWGLGKDRTGDAIAQANTPFFDSLMRDYPHSQLITYGEEVGLPEGQMGNSEVGHLNIGAGRVVYQELARINKAAKTTELGENVQLLAAIAEAQRANKPIHLMGLLSDGGVHSHIEHLLALCRLLHTKVKNVYIHAFTDGRDTDPHSAVGYVEQLQNACKAMPNVQLATIIGRYYAMDRDKRWERIQLAYDLLTAGKGVETNAPVAALKAAYKEGITDEFMPALVCKTANEERNKSATISDTTIGDTTIGDGDVVLCFNFRTDRCRQITEALSQRAIADTTMQPLKLHYFTMARYDEKFTNIGVLFEKDDLSQTLGEVLAAAGKTQLRIAETEKYPHVTFFFSGGREQPFEGEHRIIVPSPKVATYDLQPEMSAYGITAAVLEQVETVSPDFIALNYANADMVGHTGIFAAAMQAAEAVDNCLSQLVPVLLAKNYAVIVIADHGNSDYMRNPDGSPNTAHSMNPVPCILATNPAQNIQINTIKDGKLADLAPTILKLLGIAAPKAMDGEPLF